MHKREFSSRAVALVICTVVLLAGGGMCAAQTAVVKGTVSYTGEVPAPKKIKITKDEETCGSGDREIPEITITAVGRLRDVVVFVDGEIEGAPPGAPVAYELIQEGCRFRPNISYVPKNETLKIVNADPVAHNIHTYEKIGRAKRDLFNFSQPEQGHTKELAVKPRRGNVVQLNCDIHDFMNGWIFVPENPFAVVAAEGSFKLAGIPAGTHTLKVFHPTLGFLEQEVELAAGKTAEVSFVFEGG